MFLTHLSDADVAYHHDQVRSNYLSAQRLISIRGLREIVGNTFIQMGSGIRGKARKASTEAEVKAIARRSLAGGVAR